MKKNLRNVVVFVSLLGFTTCAFAFDILEQLESIIPSEVARVLIASGKIQRTAYRQKNAILNYIPQTALGSAVDIFMNAVDSDMSFICESLYLYAKQEDRRGEVGADSTDISVILRSISHLEGIEYYSASRRQMRTLYEKSYPVDNLISRTRIPDPVTGEADGLSVPVVQKDLTFGEYAHQVYWRHVGAEASFFSENIEYVRYGIFKLIKPGNLRLGVVVFDLGDYLLVYGLSGADFLAVPGIEAKLRDSFISRADAIFAWFIREYENYN
jgi:hypothetical protein